MAKLTKTTQSGIFTRKNKNGTISYVAVYRNPISKKTCNTTMLVKSERNRKFPLEAKRKLFDFLDELTAETKYEDFSDESISLEKLADLYFEYKENDTRMRLRDKYPNLSKEQFEKYPVVIKKLNNLKGVQNKYNKHIKPYKLSAYPIKDLNKKITRDYVENTLKKLDISSRYKHNILILIRTIINYGVSNDIINSNNSFDNIKIKFITNKRERALNKIELKQLLDRCKLEKQDNIYLSVYLAIITAGRANTVLNIRKKDILFKEKYIVLNNFKTDKIYKLKLPDSVVEELKIITKDLKEKEFLIKSNREVYENFPMAYIPKKVYDIMDELFNENLDKSNNEDRNNVANFHSLRRSVATNYAVAGVSLFNIMILLNHSNVKQTMTYLNLDMNNMNEYMDNFLEGIV